MKFIAPFAALALALVGCETSHHIIVEQPKPMEIKVDLTGRLELVITDARSDVQQITGQEPKRKVNPADILPPDALQGSALPTTPLAPTSEAPSFRPNGRQSEAPIFRPNGPQLSGSRGREAPVPSAAYSEGPTGRHSLTNTDDSQPVLLLADFRPPTPRPLAAEDDPIASMAARYAQVAALLDAKVAGESHSGLLAPRGTLTADQQTLMTAENTDRQKLYQVEATKKNISAEKVALGYFVARLDHINKGVWYEKYNKTSKAWEWAQME